MNILAVDIGGTRVKCLATGASEPKQFISGSSMTPEQMVSKVRRLAESWRYSVVSIGYPGVVLHGKLAREPHNLAGGWVEFDFEAAFGCPIKLINDAAMQALGSYEQGKMLFLGLGTGLGSALVIDGVVQGLELAHLPFKKGRTYEDYLGARGFERLGKDKWSRSVEEVVELFRAAFIPDEIVLGGGNAKKLKRLRPDTRLADNSNAFIGGFRLWQPKCLKI